MYRDIYKFLPMHFSGIKVVIETYYSEFSLFRCSRMFVSKCHSRNRQTFPWRKHWISTKGHVPSVVCYGLHCSGSCPLLHLGCVHSQVASEASVTTTERHLTNRLAPAGGRGRSTQVLTKCCHCGHVLCVCIYILYIRIFYIYYTKMFFLSSTNPMKRSKPKMQFISQYWGYWQISLRHE